MRHALAVATLITYGTELHLDMPIYSISAQARQAHASPSISMEKGTYRIRPPRSRTPSILRHASRVSPSATNSINAPDPSSIFERYLFAIVLLLMLGIVFCFAAAYHLFKTR